MEIVDNLSLADYTSLGVGGPAERAVIASNSEELIEILSESKRRQTIWLLGGGSNVLVSDYGLPGLTILQSGGRIVFDQDKVLVDSGVEWDALVEQALKRKLWGIELLSEVPGTIAGATFINIAAYGQTIGERIEWVEAWDRLRSRRVVFHQNQLELGYKQTIFQNSPHLIITRVCLNLSKKVTHVLEYQKALEVAEELQLSVDSLTDRRQIIIETRRRSGSIWHPHDPRFSRTAGSFFRNPLVPEKLANAIINFDETETNPNIVKKMNTVHGGSANRVSAAHVLLAAGFKRGQNWGRVKLNDQNLLKIEALSGATAQDIYNVMLNIQSSVLTKLGLKLEPEVRLLGKFKNKHKHIDK